MQTLFEDTRAMEEEGEARHKEEVEDKDTCAQLERSDTASKMITGDNDL